MTDDIKVTMNSGASGCVFHPAFLPKTTDTEYKNIMKYLGDPSKYVNKYMSLSSAEDEVKLSNIMMKIDPNFNFLLYPLVYIVKETDIPKKYIEMCEKTSKDTKEFVSIYSPYGGIDCIQLLIKYIRKKNNILNQLAVVTMFINSIEGLLLLHKNGIVHLDIKLQNFLVTEGKDEKDIEQYLKDLKIKYTDYGLSHNFNESKTPSVITAEYSQWPFDYIIANRIQAGHDINKYLDNFDLKTIYPEFSGSGYPDDLKNSNIKSIKEDFIEFITNIDKTDDYYKLVDIYMLGCTFNMMFDTLKIKKSTIIKDIIYGMTRIYPSLRFNDDKLRLELINLKVMLLQTEKELIKKNIL